MLELKRYYDAYWAGKDDAFDPSRLALLRDAIPRGSLVLEVGCGPGILGGLLREREVTVVGVDFSVVALRRALAKGVLAVEWDPGQSLPFLGGSFSCAVSNSSLEHLFQPDPVLAEIHRVLAPGGRFLWMVPNIGHWRFRLWLLAGRFPTVADSATDPLHIRMYTLREATDRLRAHGFEMRSITGSAGTWVPRLYPRLFRAPGIRHLYERLAPLWPSLFCRYMVLEVRKVG